MKRTSPALSTTLWTVAAALALTACGDNGADDDDDHDHDAAVEPDAGPSPDADTSPDAAPPLPDPTPAVTPLSATAADGLNAVAFAADGSFYAIEETVGVWRMSANAEADVGARLIVAQPLVARRQRHDATQVRGSVASGHRERGGEQHGRDPHERLS